MAIIRYSYPNTRAALFGRSPWSALETEIDQLFGSALSGLNGPASAGQLAVDLDEDNDNTYVRAELPGVAKEDINVEVLEETLTITATRKQRKADKEEESLSFSRSVTIPEHVQADKVSATYENGVLTVTLPKREKPKPSKIAIR